MGAAGKEEGLMHLNGSAWLTVIGTVLVVAVIVAARIGKRKRGAP